MEACLFQIMELDERALRAVLPKASVRVLTRLITAYPRSIGRTFIEVLAETMSPATLEFMKEEIQVAQIPSYGQIRDAERELLKIMHEEHLLTEPT